MGKALKSYLDEQRINNFFIDKKPAMKKADVIIDFSAREATFNLLDYAKKMKIPTVIGTTGHNKEDLAYILDASNTIPLLLSSNFSIGLSVVNNMLSSAAAIKDWECAICETHHKNKKDVPSGTALTLSKTLSELGFSNVACQSLRIGDFCGRHTLLFANGQESITITHNANDKSIFCRGALTCALWLLDKPKGLYNIQDVIKNAP